MKALYDETDSSEVINDANWKENLEFLAYEQIKIITRKKIIDYNKKNEDVNIMYNGKTIKMFYQLEQNQKMILFWINH